LIAAQQIASLYQIESEIRGSSADERRTARQERSKPVTSAMKAWLEKTLAQVPGGSTLAQIIRKGLRLAAGTASPCSSTMVASN
jgi:transposase